MATDDVLAITERAAEGIASGTARIVASSAESRYDDEGDPYVLLVLRLAPPSQGEDTWVLDDVHAVRDRVRQELDRAGVAVPVRLSLASEEEGFSELRSDEDVARSLAAADRDDAR